MAINKLTDFARVLNDSSRGSKIIGFDADGNVSTQINTGFAFTDFEVTPEGDLVVTYGGTGLESHNFYISDEGYLEIDI